MAIASRYSFTPQHLSLPSFIFGSPDADLSSNDKTFVDAERPNTHYLTLSSYREWSKRFAAGLIAAGFEQGDRLMLFSGNSIFTPIVIMGTLMAGGIYNSANPAYNARELLHQLKDSEPKFVLAARNCLDCALEAAELANFGSDRVFLFDDMPTTLAGHFDVSLPQTQAQCRSWQHHIAPPLAGAAFKWEKLDTPALSARTAIIIYSSGTTGLPKGVELTHFNLVSNIYQVRKMHQADTPYGRRSLCCLPMYHVLGQVYYNFFAPKAGLQVVLMQRYELLSMLQHIQKFKITELVIVPPIVVAIAKHPAARSGQVDLSSIKKVPAGAAPLGIEATRQFEELWNGKLRVRQAWGMSEAPAMSLCWHEGDKNTDSSTSVGELLAGNEAKIVDEEGSLQPRGKRGELWLKGPNIMKGYWRNLEATKATFSNDGFLMTGDIAYCDDEGKLFIVDRKKVSSLFLEGSIWFADVLLPQELIKVRGAQVAPAELESLLLEHPALIDAAVVGVSVDGDEHPRAYVVAKPDSSVTGDEVVAFVRERVAKVKRLTGGVALVKSIPKNGSGKILRRQLREMAQQESLKEASKAKL